MNANAAAGFTDIQACVFDAYGTLLDFNSAAAQARDVPGEQAATLSELWRAKQVQYTWLRALMGSHAPFWQVTGEALDFALEALAIDNPALRRRLMQCYRQLAAFLLLDLLICAGIVFLLMPDDTRGGSGWNR